MQFFGSEAAIQSFATLSDPHRYITMDNACASVVCLPTETQLQYAAGLFGRSIKLRIILLDEEVIAIKREVLATFNSDGTRGPSYFESGMAKAIDCISIVDGAIEDADRPKLPKAFPTNVGKGSWVLGTKGLRVSEDGENYRMTWLEFGVIREEQSLPLDINLVPKLAMSILIRFRSS